MSAGLLGVVVLSGCSSTLSSDELETQLTQAYKDQTGIGIDTISCKEAETSTGSPISCEATNADGIDLAISGKVTAFDTDSQTADFSWSAEPVAGSGGQ